MSEKLRRCPKCGFALHIDDETLRVDECRSNEGLKLNCLSITDVIGNTPALRLDRLVQYFGFRGNIILKLEYLNPGFSKKDRVALEIVKESIADGSLLPGQTVVELTSGNTGTGLAIVCGALGHPFVAVMSRGNSTERVRMIKALGGSVELVDQNSDGVPGQVSGADLELVEIRTQKLVRELGAFRADQFSHAGNTLAHERHTAPELWRQCCGRIDAFVDFIGTSGSFIGIMRGLRKRDSRIRGYVVEPEGAAVLSGSAIQNSGHRIQGGGYSMKEPPLFDSSLVDGYLVVDDERAISTARLLARFEGVFAGFSTGANVAGALQLLERSDKLLSVAVLACDSGLKYLSTDLYE